MLVIESDNTIQLEEGEVRILLVLAILAGGGYRADTEALIADADKILQALRARVQREGA